MMQLPLIVHSKIIIFFFNCLNSFLLLGPVNNLGLEMLSSMFGGLGAGSLAVPNRSNG